MYHRDTIVAIATANSGGAISIVRLSGDDAIAICQKCFKGKSLLTADSHSVIYGHIVDENEVIDEVMVSVFRAPKSFTTENSVEINCHASSYITQKIIEVLLKSGARLANAGEFTMRAFLNGRIDLTQAEAVADLIAADNKASHEIALNQMRGGIASELQSLREELIRFTALLELELDFSEEDVEFANRKDFFDLIEKLKAHLSSLILSFDLGNAIKNGVPVAIVGNPNAGKSTLLNALLNEERAIVSDIAGTTRDTIEEAINIDGINYRFIDTAGIRDAKDEIEKIGIERSKSSIEKARIILYLASYDEMRAEDVFVALKDLNLQPEKTIIVCNKIDAAKEGSVGYINNYKTVLSNFGFENQVFISAKEKQGIDSLKIKLKMMIGNSETNTATIITNERHKEALEKTLLALCKAEEGFQVGLSNDLIAFHLKDSLKYLGSITGKIDVDKDILGTIFGSFCIGK